MSVSRKNILVSGASGIIGYGILKSLRGFGYKLIGTTIYKDSIASNFSDLVEIVPSTNTEGYIESLISIIKKHQIDLVIPAIEVDVIKMSEFKDRIESETSTLVLTNNIELIKVCSDKWLFYQKLKKFNSPYMIETFLDIDRDFKFPLILKPRKGSSSKGIVIVHDNDTLYSYKSKIGNDLMIQPLIGSSDEEYTVSAFFDKNSNLCSFICLKRKLSGEGFTQIAQTVEIDNIENVLLDLAKIFNPIGATNFQFRIDKKQLKILEINPRISSATSIRTAFGYNESLMSVEYFLEQKLPKNLILKKGKAIRYTEEIIIYEQ